MPSTYPIILYDSIFTGSSMSASATAVGYSVENLPDYRSYTYWQAPSSGTVWIKIHCTAARAANAIGIVGHDLFSKNATISLQHFSSDSVTAADWSTSIAGFTPTDDYALMKTFPGTTDLWWKITVECATLCKMAVVVLGEKLQFPVKPAVPIQPYSIGMEIESNRGKTGHILGSVVRYKPVSISHRMPPAESNYAWYTSTFLTFWKNHGSEMKPFFYAMDLDAYSTDVHWVTLSPDSQYALNMQQAGRVEDMTISMQGMWE